MDGRAGLWFQAAFLLLWAVICILRGLDLIGGELNVPRWLILTLGGVLVLLTLRVVSAASSGDAARSAPERFLYRWIGPIAILFLAVMAVWIGFGPGERHSAVSGSLPFLFGRTAGGTETRIVFGTVGVVLSALAAVVFLSAWRSR